MIICDTAIPSYEKFGHDFGIKRVRIKDEESK